MKLADFKGIFKKSYLELASVENPHGDYYLVKLELNDKSKWIAGEHASFSLPNRKVTGKKWRAFSIASIDNEGYMLIGTRTGKEISSFKNNLIDMKPGERVNIRGPFGWFKIIDKQSPMILIASGVGITPIRSLLKEIQNETTREVNLIYASSDYYLFGEEIEIIAKNNPKINLIKTTNRKATQAKISEFAMQYENKAFYYISGSMPFINSTKKLLKEQNINKKQVINDPFLGY
jgi:ferredoxin-NADP reductase